jgi:hypothetical protein
MNKSVLEKFITKYNLGGSCESVKFVSTAPNLTTKGITEDKNVFVEVVASNVGLENGEFPILDTAKLRSLLSVLDENISCQVNKFDGRSVGMEFSDDSTNVTFVLADAAALPQVPTVKLPRFELELTLDEKFINTFIKGKSALSDVDIFTIISNGKTNNVDVIIGYSKNNTNRVKIQLQTKAPVKIGPINFSAKYFKEILVANKDAELATLSISSDGLAFAQFTTKDIVSKYFLVELENA